MVIMIKGSFIDTVVDFPARSKQNLAAFDNKALKCVVRMTTWQMEVNSPLNTSVISSSSWPSSREVSRIGGGASIPEWYERNSTRDSVGNSL